MERRSKLRFPVQVAVRYRSLEHKQSIYKLGKTTDMSSRGVLVATQDELDFRVGAKVELKIEWTYPLDGAIPLNLVVIGRVVRCGHSAFAATFERREFRVANRLARCAAGQSG